MNMSRRSLLSTAVPLSAAALMGLSLASCASTTNPTTGAVTYGLDPAVIATITTGVQFIANYAPTIESIAATAAGLFGPGFAAVVVAGSAAVNAVISTLTNLVPTLPVGAKTGRRLGVASAGTLKGYARTANGYIPVYAQ
jgi:hypothetical protein